MTENKEWELRPLVSPSDKEFREKIGEELWEEIKWTHFRDSNFKCNCCKFEPYESVDMNDVFDLHLVKEDFEKPRNSIFMTVCKLCHVILHADAAVQLGIVQLVNSFKKQHEIINIIRNNSLSNHIENGDIRFIKKTLPEYLEELNNGKAFEGKVKFVFTKDYLETLGIHI